MTTPLIDRYLQTVRRSLQTPRRDDIVRELAEDLHERVSDREAALGRPLTEEETKGVLEQLGHLRIRSVRSSGPERSAQAEPGAVPLPHPAAGDVRRAPIALLRPGPPHDDDDRHRDAGR